MLFNNAAEDFQIRIFQIKYFYLEIILHSPEVKFTASRDNVTQISKKRKFCFLSKSQKICYTSFLFWKFCVTYNLSPRVTPPHLSKLLSILGTEFFRGVKYYSSHIIHHTINFARIS